MGHVDPRRVEGGRGAYDYDTVVNKTGLTYFKFR